jgi:ubiquinone/menaquinone biosynthesis C-methylase UbiE
MTLRLMRFVLPKLEWNQEVYGRLLGEYVNVETRWLEAGCGHRLLGWGLEKIEQELMARPKSVVGVDLDLSALRRHENLHFAVCGNLDSLPFPDGSFDLVTSNMVVEHLSDPSATLGEFCRVLAPGGVLVIHTPNLMNYAVAISRALKALLPRRVILWLIRLIEWRTEEDVFPTYYRANTARRLRSILAQFGMAEENRDMLVGPQPVSAFFAPIALLEMLLIRATLQPALRSLRTSIFGVYRKFAPDSPSMEQPEISEPIGLR